MSTQTHRPRPLTVAVTGPTGEIGKTFIRALERAEGVGEIRGMAGGPFDPASFGWERTPLRPGRHPGPRGGRRAGGGCRRGRPPRLHHLRRRPRRPAQQPRGLAQRVRRHGRGRCPAPRLHLLGGRLRLPRRQPAAAERGRPAAREREPLLLGPEGRARGRAGRGAGRQRRPRPTCSAPRSSAARDSPAPDRAPALRAGRRGAARAGAPAVDALPTPAPVLPDFGVPLQLVHAEDVADALVAGSPRPGRAGDLQPRRRRARSPSSDIAREMGWNSVRLPRTAIDLAGAELRRALPVHPRRRPVGAGAADPRW